ncbi:hypothetical protein CARUB_v10027670mg [Capsella rubella]|uniref:DUF4371 domain-containing protein n=1 Tax=Capsella rubella TaxID=81985 RepID=R0EZR7_9BRAS|nr:hypothetical protein CARUB_v10027670mg [Capsella rubella]
MKPADRKKISEYHPNERNKIMLVRGEEMMHGPNKLKNISEHEGGVNSFGALAEQNEVMSKVVLGNAPGNNQMMSPKIQKDFVHCFAEELIKSIIEEIDHDVFGLLVDESADVSDKEQMVVVFRFVDKNGITSSSSLKSAVDSEFAKYGLSIKKVRGQSYDGESNMKGEFNGLRSLISKENTSTYFVHFFFHQLQLVVVAIAKKHFGVGDFFDMISILMNVVGGSCKRKEMLRESYREEIEKAISDGELNTEKGLNQEISLKRPANTRWNSHYMTLLRLVELFSSIIKVLKYVHNEGVEDSKRRQAHGLLNYFYSFEFVFNLHMMIHLLGLTNSLSMALQRRDQDIAETIPEKHDIENLKMEEEFVNTKKPRKKIGITNEHYFKFNDRFNEVNTDLLIFAAYLSSIDSLSQYDQKILMRLSNFYPFDFTHGEYISLLQQLDIYNDNVRSDERFTYLKSLGELARMLVETIKHMSYPLVYRLLKLILILVVATAMVERCFSAMKIMKADRRNRIGDSF